MTVATPELETRSRPYGSALWEYWVSMGAKFSDAAMPRVGEEGLRVVKYFQRGGEGVVVNNHSN